MAWFKFIIYFQLFARTSSAVKEPFFAFLRLLPHVGLFQRAARSSCGSFFISALPLTCVSHAHVSGFFTDGGVSKTAPGLTSELGVI